MPARILPARSNGTSGTKRWQVHVVRLVKELVMQARTATWQLAQELGRTPTESDPAASPGGQRP
jgi:hypothetical protein